MEEEINLMHGFKIIYKRRWFVVIFVFVVTSITMVITLLIPNTYRSETKILPLDFPGGIGASSGASSFAAPLLGFGNNISTAASKLMVILTSRTLAENVINRLDLMPVFFPDDWDSKKKQWKEPDLQKRPASQSMEGAVENLFSMLQIEQDTRRGVISIAAISPDPIITAKVVNTITDELQELMNNNTYTMAKRQRIFIEGQMATMQKELLVAGKELTEYYKKQSISAVNPQLDVIIPSTLLLSDTVQATSTGLSGIDQKNLENLEEGIKELSRHKEQIDEALKTSLVVRNVPHVVYLDYLTSRKKILEQLNGLVHNQYEMARVQEAKEDVSFQIIDPGQVPVKKFGPKRRKITKWMFLLSSFTGIFGVVLWDYTSKSLKVLLKAR